MNIHTAIERITPAQAERYLERNTINRKMKENHILRIASDMAEGRWHVNGSSIVFNSDGTLLDGQHRLAAVVRSGVPVDMLVVRGVSKAAMTTIDANVARSAGDVAHMQGHANTNHLVGVIRLIISLKANNSSTGLTASTGAVMEFLRMHPRLADSVIVATKFNRTLPVSPVAAWHYLAFYIGGFIGDVERAVGVMETGIPAYENDAIHVFRERAIRDRSAMQGGVANRMRGFWTLALAWNDFHKREPRSLCRIQPTEIKINGVDYSKL